jgi:hypothetical protein
MGVSPKLLPENLFFNFLATNFHAGNRGSNPLGDASNYKGLQIFCSPFLLPVFFYAQFSYYHFMLLRLFC